MEIPCRPCKEGLVKFNRTCEKHTLSIVSRDFQNGSSLVFHVTVLLTSEPRQPHDHHDLELLGFSLHSALCGNINHGTLWWNGEGSLKVVIEQYQCEHFLKLKVNKGKIKFIHSPLESVTIYD